MILRKLTRKLTLIKYLRNSVSSPANNDFTQIIIIKDVCEATRHASYHDSYHNKWAQSLIRFKRS